MQWNLYRVVTLETQPVGSYKEVVSITFSAMPPSTMEWTNVPLFSSVSEMTLNPKPCPLLGSSSETILW